jgi:hypothetical protein
LQRPRRLCIFDSGYAACSGRAAYIFLTAAMPLAAAVPLYLIYF